jgi:hypothetical protein
VITRGFEFVVGHSAGNSFVPRPMTRYDGKAVNNLQLHAQKATMSMSQDLDIITMHIVNEVSLLLLETDYIGSC